MKRIKQLSKNLINQIAAGEVIERPASVVKELVENSIDSGANRISIEVYNECRDIRVADNGSGIHPEDILLAFTKHATSKIQEDSDLFDINTLGFRGEALATIISISKLTCTTRTKDHDNGTKVICENSEVKQVETGCAVGTIMDIKNLFYNIPARLKFLKNTNTEFSYIQEIVQAMALSHPEIGFELKKYGKTVLHTTGQKDLLHTIKEVFATDIAKNLKEVLKTDELSGLKISGYVSTPDLTRSSKKNYHLYINSRVVKCPIFQKSIDNVYKHLISSGKYPFIVLNLEIPSHDVDVNVHPTKKEVRYKNPNQIFNFIYSSVEAGLSNYVEKEVYSPLGMDDNKPHLVSTTPQINCETPKFEFRPISGNNDDVMYITNEEVEDNVVKMPFFSQKNMFEQKVQEETPTISENIIGQYHDTYILIDTTEGLEIVDQHIAQERYLYEKLKSEKEIVSQILFISDVIELSTSEVELIRENLKKFDKYGYGIEIISDTEILFRKLPQVLTKTEPKEIIADILENIEGGFDDIEEKILKTTACKASVKANTRLSTWQMQDIISKWRTTKMPYTCPHGRPISKIIPHLNIAGYFERNK